MWNLMVRGDTNNRSAISSIEWFCRISHSTFVSRTERPKWYLYSRNLSSWAAVRGDEGAEALEEFAEALEEVAEALEEVAEALEEVAEEASDDSCEGSVTGESSMAVACSVTIGETKSIPSRGRFTGGSKMGPRALSSVSE